MRISGEATLQAPAQKVWEAILDPAVLVRTIPGCDRLETVGEHTYAMTVTVGVASIVGTYSGTCRLSELDEPSSLLLSVEGSGAPGTIAADVKVGFTDRGDGTTSVSYDADAVVGGPIGGVGQRMLGSVSTRKAGEFFKALDGVLTGAEPAVAGAPAAEVPAGAPAAEPGVYTAPRAQAAPTAQQDFLKGVAVGAGLVALGVVIGAVVGGRR